MSKRGYNLLAICVVVLTAALATSARGDVNVTQNIAFTANGKNPWGPGNALEVGDSYTLIDIPFNPPPPTIRVDLPTINANPVDAALDALAGALGVPLPSLVKLQFGGSATGSAHIGFEYFASLGRLNINYPARSTLNLPDFVRSNELSLIGSTFQPGVSNREIGDQQAIEIGGIGYSEPILGGLKFTSFSTPKFATTAPYAEAKLEATADVRAGLFTEVSALFGLKKWRKDFNFGGPVGGPLIEIDPSGLYVAGQDTGLFSLTQPISVPLPGIGTATVTYPKLGLTGAPNAPNSPVLHGQNVSEVFRVEADLEKLIPLIGPLLHNSIAGVEYDLLNISGAPVVSVYQDQTFTPDPRVQLQFSELVLVDGQPTKVVERPLGTPINWEPMFSNSPQITITPLYILNNTFRNETGLDFSLEVDLEAIGFDAPFLPEYVGPLINPDPVNVPLFRVPLLEPDPWQINLDTVVGAPITIPKLNVDAVPNLGDLRLTFTELVSGTAGTGDATYTLHFNRDVLGGPPREYQATVAGVGSVFELPFGEGVLRSGLFEANEDVVLTDPVTSEQHNLGRNFCLNGCDLSQTLPGPNPTFVVEDPDNPGQFLPPLYVTTLPDIPNTDVDTVNHPILGHPDMSNVNDVADEEYGTAVTDLRDGPETTVLARTQTINPEGDGRFDSFSALSLPPILDNSGGAGLVARSETFDDSNPRGYYYANGSTTYKIVRDGDPVPGEDGAINVGETVRRMNDVGQTAFTALGGEAGVYRVGPDGLVTIAAPQQTVPEGDGYIAQSYNVDAINNLGQVAFQALVYTPADEYETAVYRGDDAGLTKIVRQGEALPGFAGAVDFMASLSLNENGQVAFLAGSLESSERGILVGDGSTVTPIALSGQAAPHNAQFISPSESATINNSGQVAFNSLVEVSPGSGQLERGVYLGDGTQTIQIARTGDAAPAQDGTLEAVDFGLNRLKLNDVGQVLFSGRIDSGDADYYALLRGDASDLTEVVRGGQAAPDGNGTFLDSEESFFYGYALNNEGHVAFAMDLLNTAGGAADNHGIFVYDGENIVQVARTGQSLAGSTIASLAFATQGENNSGLNDAMQVGYRATLADGREVIARFEPSLYWRNLGDGAWAAGGNWSLGVEPTNPYDVSIVAENALTVFGPAVNRTVKSLSIGGDDTAIATLNLASGITLTATNGTTIRANGILSGAGTIAGDVANLGGTVSPGDSPGVLNVDGDFAQDSLGLLMLEIGGPSAGANYDVLNVSGDVQLGGVVALIFLDGYTPAMGMQFDLLHFGGSFDATQASFYVSGAPAGLQYSAFARDGVFGLEIAAVPEPSAAMLCVLGLSLFLWRRIRCCGKHPAGDGDS